MIGIPRKQAAFGAGVQTYPVRSSIPAGLYNRIDVRADRDQVSMSLAIYQDLVLADKLRQLLNEAADRRGRLVILVQVPDWYEDERTEFRDALRYELQNGTDLAQLIRVFETALHKTPQGE